ncbi:MAG: polysaccharide pyruvyl transferase family protein [Gammaproteobacteria bacterium]|nr:polysaccharide pyruvyl transferase family protein [Gammaproteobacteria bacterium]
MKIVLTRVLPASQKGDLAIAQAELDSLRKRWPNAEIVLMSRRPQEDAPHFSAADRVLPELITASASPAQLVFSGMSAGTSSRAFQHAIADADLLLFCGGGSPGGYGFGNLVKHALLPARIARRAGVPYAFAGLGLHRYSNRLHRRLHAQVLRRAVLVTARDPLSFRELQALAPCGDIGLTADWAWLLDPEGQREARELIDAESAGQPDSLRVGLNLRSDQAVDPEANTGHRGGTMDLFRETIPRWLKHSGADLFVFSMNGPPASNDLEFARSVLGGLDSKWRSRIHLLRGDYSPRQLKGMIGTLDLFVGTRLHPSLFAASMGVPLMTVHDHPKVRGFMRQIGQERWHLTLNGLGSDALFQKWLELRNEASDIAGLLREKSATMERLAMDNIDWIERVLNPADGGRVV